LDTSLSRSSLPCSTSRITPIVVTILEIDAIRTGSSGVTPRLTAGSAKPSARADVSPLRSKVTRTEATGCAALAAANRKKDSMG
jgi:hypothetical protein